jgi:hypothetical protein
MASLEQGRRKRGGWGAFLAKQLTLSQPGGQIIPTTVLQAPPPNFQTLRRACGVGAASESVRGS